MFKNPLTDAGVGRALFTTRFGLSLQAGIMCLMFGAIPAFVLCYVLWFALSPAQNVDLVRFGWVSKLIGQDTVHRWRFRQGSDERRVLTAVLEDGSTVQWMTARQAWSLLPALRAAQVTFDTVVLASGIAALLGFGAVWFYLRRLGAGSQENRRLRGAELIIKPDELSRRVRRLGGSDYTLAEVALPRAAPMGGVMVLGATGSGKSAAIHDLMTQVFARKRKCVIYDQSGEFYAAHFRPGTDVFFNPALLGSVPWSIFSEIRYSADADTLAHAVLPKREGAGASGFFEDAARTLFSTMLWRLAQAGAKSTVELVDAFLKLPPEQMDHLVRNTVASSAIGGDSKTQRQGVIASIAIYLNGIAAVQRGFWSMRNFIEAQDDARLFIVGTADTKGTFAPLYRLLLTVAFDTIAANAKRTRKDRYWFFLDEVHTLGDIKLDEQLATLRKFGVCIVSGIQSESQFVTSIGKERAATVSNCFNTALLLQANEADMQDRIARRLGKVEMDTVTRNQALAVAEWRDGAGLNKSESEKWLVMPSEVSKLDPGNGWIKLNGSLPPATVNYGSWFRPAKGRPPYADRFNEVQPLPARDQRFALVRAETDDALESLKDQYNDYVQNPAGPGQAKPKPDEPPIVLPDIDAPSFSGALSKKRLVDRLSGGSGGVGAAGAAAKPPEGSAPAQPDLLSMNRSADGANDAGGHALSLPPLDPTSPEMQTREAPANEFGAEVQPPSAHEAAKTQDLMGFERVLQNNPIERERDR